MYNNAIFISKEVSSTQSNLSVEEIYKKGYVDRPDRKKSFHTTKMWIFLSMDKHSAVDFINNLFKNYDGKYLLN